MRAALSVLCALLFAGIASADEGELHAEMGEDGVYFEWLDVADEAEARALGFEHDEWLEAASGRRPEGTSTVRVGVRFPDGRVARLVDYLPVFAEVPRKEPGLRSAPVSHPGRADGALDGKAVYVSQCHGWQWYSTLGRFSTQRGVLWETVEDLHNPEGSNFFLHAYLENAGAGVFTAKERDTQTRMAIADNDGQGFAETGSGFANGPAGFRQLTRYPLGTDPFDQGTTRTFPADGGGKATWTPNVPADGRYAVYVSWDSDGANASNAHYRITHPGGSFDRYFDQTAHGSTWQYVDRLWLTQGQSITVELLGDSNQAGKKLSADAVRIGGGMGDVERHGDLSTRPRWEEAAQLHGQFLGAPQSVYFSAGDDSSDPSARSRWADWEHPDGEDAVYLSWHSNAASGTARGTLTYHAGSECSSTAITGSAELASKVNREIITAFRANWESSWPERGTNGVATSCFAEVNPGYNNEMPAALVELAFHDNETDNSYLKQPRFRRDAARGMYRGIVRYFAERDGQTAHYLPEPPTHVAAVHDASGKIRVSWQAGPSGSPDGDAAESYILFTSKDGRAWDEGTAVSGTSTLVNAPYVQQYYRVVGVNQGGWSFSSEVVGARRSPDGAAPVLVVGAFDRLDSGLLELVNAGSIGNVRRMDIWRMNPLEIIVPHGRAIAGAGWFFDSASDEAVAGMDLSAYRAVVWATGEESTVDETFSAAQQGQLSAYLANGGALWASGSEIMWDLDEKGSAGDQDFAWNVLGSGLATDAASGRTVTGEGVLAGISMKFGVADGAPYPVEYPDGLASSRPVIARYSSGEVAAVLGEGVALFGFPFDAIVEEQAQADVAARLLEALVPDIEQPVVDTSEPLPGDTGSPVGPGGPNGERLPLRQRSCGCASGGAGGLPVGLLLLVSGLLLRRRREA